MAQYLNYLKEMSINVRYRLIHLGIGILVELLRLKVNLQVPKVIEVITKVIIVIIIIIGLH